MQNPKILICSSEVGAGKRGASLGPDAVRLAAVNAMYNLFETVPREEIKTRQLNRFSPEYKSAKYIKLIASTHTKIARKVSETLRQGYSPLIFSGDHSNAAGFLAGFREVYPDSRIGVIWIDAHGDLHSPYTSPSGNVHGMPVAILLGQDNIENSRRKLKPEVIKSWERIKRIGKLKRSPKLSPADIVFIDIRDLEQQEWDMVRRLGIKHYTPAHRHQMGIKTIASEVVQYFTGYDLVYVSFDVDSLDPTISEGTGTPVPDGLNLEEAKHLIRTFTAMPNFKALEITEVNPLLDTQNRMANAVVNILRDSLTISLRSTSTGTPLYQGHQHTIGHRVAV